MNTRDRIIRTLILAVVGLLVGGLAALWSVNREPSPDASGSSSHQLVATSIGGPFNLIDQDGQPRSEKDWPGKYKLVYFGFTYCPAICPTELSKMAEAVLALTPVDRSKLQPVFISVDPERDTPEVLKNYVALFMPELVGLTGSLEQVEAAKKAYKVYAAKVPDEDGKGGYTMDHSSLIYLINPEGQAIGMFKASDSAKVVEERLRSVLETK